jgi:diaminohydroxyphosphoribosylaminopyrimidine deaminase/5-amino-6-(5-phosphoribosylamino)uracil reductase
MTRDETMMQRALACAARAWGETSPNPMVGAVLARGDRVLGEAWHSRAGQPHAEPQVLQVLRKPSDVEPAGSEGDLTLYVNLEPCNHVGRTPPCTETILASPVRQVVVSMPDPDPRVSGRGIERLRAAGVEVRVGVLERPARELNHAYLGRQLRGRPFIALKVALSADGCIAGAQKQPVRITGDSARRHTHEVRAGMDAILVGIETLRLDRPRLDCRLATHRQNVPRRLILDPGLRLQDAWLRPGAETPLVLCSAAALLSLPAARRRQLEERVQLQVVPGRRDHLDLQALPDLLAAHNLWSVLVEGGGDTHRRFLDADLWDRMYVYRNESLRLHGLPWSAASLWESRSEAILLRTERLGESTCHVHTHPLAWGAHARPADAPS